jgi:hypothetical protein
MALKNSLNDFGTRLLAGLPIEAGLSAASVVKAVNTLENVQAKPVALFSELMFAIRTGLEPLTLDRSKQELMLNKAELLRQAWLIDLYLRRDQLPLALGLLREWVVSLLLFHHPPFEDKSAPTATGWLHKSNRERAERSLGALAAMMRSEERRHLDENSRKWGQFWDRLQGLRNEFMHQGMKPETVSGCLPKEIADFWNSIKDGQTPPPHFGGGRGRLLISPQGLTPGVLFSAVHHAKPDVVLVVCSAQSRNSVPEVLGTAGYNGETAYCEVTDPHGGFPELKLRQESSQKILLEADAVVANLTGGTTFMGILVQSLIDGAKRLDRPAARFALVDRRPTVEQQREPFVQSDIHWLDPKI